MRARSEQGTTPSSAAGSSRTADLALRFEKAVCSDAGGMHDARPLSDYDYRWALRTPEEVGLVFSALATLPTLVEPADQPVVSDPVDEPLVDIEHRRVRNLSVYWHAGWPSAGPRTLARAGVASRLGAVADALPDRFGLAVLDAWRPLELQRAIYDAAYADPLLPEGFVSVPSDDPTTPPPHLTGGTVDVTLTWDGHALALGTGFDDFSPDAHTDAFEGRSGTVRALRWLLYGAMRSEGFVVIDCEWWHFEYGTRRWAALTGNAPLYGPAHPAPSA